MAGGGGWGVEISVGIWILSNTLWYVQCSDCAKGPSLGLGSFRSNLWGGEGNTRSGKRWWDKKENSQHRVLSIQLLVWVTGAQTCWDNSGARAASAPQLFSLRGQWAGYISQVPSVVTWGLLVRAIASGKKCLRLTCRCWKWKWGQCALKWKAEGGHWVLPAPSQLHPSCLPCVW